MTEPSEQATTALGPVGRAARNDTGRLDDAALEGPAGAQRQPSRQPQRWRGTSKRRWGTLIVVVAVSSAAVVALRARTAPAPPVVENVATRWVERALSAVRSGNPSVHTGTPGAARTYAMTTAAMYDAVNGIERAGGGADAGNAVISSYADAPPGANRDAAASAAAYEVLRTLFGSNSTLTAQLDEAQTEELARLGVDPSVESGRAWGAAVGATVLSIRAKDGTEKGGSRQGESGPGVFPRTFSGTQFRNMAPFGIRSIGPYVSAGPPALDSAEYAEAFNEVKALGSSTDGDPERTAIARQWLAEEGTARETGLWFKAALAITAHQGTTAALSDTVRLFALLGAGIADAVAVSWTDKFTTYSWRPGDAIRQASSDGNPATEEDASWSPRNGICASTNIATCNVFGGSPEHTSGTSAFAGAAAEILAGFYCTDRIAFAFSGEQADSVPRSYGALSDAATEAGRSRIYGGVHFQFSNEAGREAGKSIGREIVRTRLLRPGTNPGAGAACTRPR